MRTLFLVAQMAAVLVAAGDAVGGSNENGVLFVHANTALVASSDPTNFCGESNLRWCRDATVVLPGGDGTTQFVWFVMAAFDSASSPQLRGVTFGLEYDPTVVLSYYDSCGDFELRTPNWPDSFEGTALTWNSAQTSWVVELYYFVGYGEAGSLFQIRPHPTQGGTFADDEVPARLDPILWYGGLGFDTSYDWINPCDGPSPVEPSSWGRIKQSYR